MDKTTLLSLAALIIAVVSLGLSLMPRDMIPEVDLDSDSGTKQWREIDSFSGSGNTTTSTFYVPSYLWRISWSVTWSNPELEGRFSTYIYSPGVVETQANALASFGGYKNEFSSSVFQSGQEDLYGSGNEDFYLKVEGTNLQLWDIKVEAWS